MAKNMGFAFRYPRVRVLAPLLTNYVTLEINLNLHTITEMVLIS